MMDEKKNVPKRRFKKFVNDGEWDAQSLSDAVEVNSGCDYKRLSFGDIPVYGTGGYMLSVNNALSWVDDAIGIGRKGTIDQPFILRAPFWTVDTLFYAIPRKSFNLNFIYGVFQNVEWRELDESTGVPSLSKQTINQVEIYAPKATEQQIIGKFMTKLDSLISLHERKLEKLQNLKQAYLAEMFPAEGETTPRRRFKGFSGEWEETYLGNIVEIIGGGTPSTQMKNYWDGDIEWFTPSEIGTSAYVCESNRKISITGLVNSAASILPANRTVLFTSRASIGDAAILLKDGTTNQGFQSFVIDDSTDIYFLYSMTPYIKKYGLHHAAGSTFIEVSAGELRKMPIVIPSIAEQKNIGEFFKRFDMQIDSQQKYVSKLRALKQAYLSELFV